MNIPKSRSKKTLNIRSLPILRQKEIHQEQEKESLGENENWFNKIPLDDCEESKIESSYVENEFPYKRGDSVYFQRGKGKFDEGFLLPTRAVNIANEKDGILGDFE